MEEITKTHNVSEQIVGIKAEEFRECSGRNHNSKSVGSIYSKKSVPIHMFRKNINNTNSNLTKSCSNCREFSYRLKKQKIEQVKKIIEIYSHQQNSHVKCCSHIMHSSISEHPQEEVPLELFQSSDKNSLFKICIDCREHLQKQRNNCREKKNKMKDEQKENKEFQFCPSKCHTAKSIYERDKVPINLFLKVPDNPKSDLFKDCMDCRNYNNKHAQARIINKCAINKELGNIFCTRCQKIKIKEEMHIKKDGTQGIMCAECRKKHSKIKETLRECYIKILFEFIDRNDSCCQKCKCIILQPVDENSGCVRLPTYDKTDGRHVDYMSQTYNVKDFLTNYKDLIELRVIDFDHLTEDEQRERKLLLPDEPYVPKHNWKKGVSKMGSENSMRLESNKCQILCIRCHIITTISREQGLRISSKLESEKLDYVNKKKQRGCQICKYTNSKLPRFFDMDHLDPNTKTMGISEMVKKSSYSLQQVKDECKLCRVICKECHRIHTHNQLKKGIISNVKKSLTTSQEIKIL